MYDVIIPVYRPGKSLKCIIRALEAQSVRPSKLILVESRDAVFPAKPEIETDLELLRLHIPASAFDHAATRNMGVCHSDQPYFVFLTQDAVPVGRDCMERLLAPLLKEKAPLSYGRQMAGPGAGPRERLTRGFNYPKRSALKSSKDKKRLGIKTYFCSNACAAYKREVFDSLGGFYAPAVFNEDMVFAHRVIEAGFSIAYAAGARVCHYHNYSIAGDFRRSFDLGASQAMHPEVFSGIRSESEGVRYVLRLSKELWKQGEYLEIPLLFIHSAARFAGYRLGRRFRELPPFALKLFSMNRGFWNKYPQKSF